MSVVDALELLYFEHELLLQGSSLITTSMGSSAVTVLDDEDDWSL